MTASLNASAPTRSATVMSINGSDRVAQPRNVDDGEIGVDEAVSFRFYQKNIGDWLSGVKGMTLEIEGAYSRFIDHLYHRGKPFPDDDRFMSAVMSIPVRVWKRVKAELVSLGKIVVRAGCLTNSRFEIERKKRAAELRKKAETAVNSWNKRRINAVSTAKNPEKVNEINDPKMDAGYNHNQRHNQKEDKIPASSPPVAARSELDDEVEGLNGSTMHIRSKIAKWMNPYQPAYREAQTWLGSTVKLFGSDVVRDAFASVEAKDASGDIIGHPIKLMTKICQQKAAEKASPAARGTSKPAWAKHLEGVAV